MSLTAPSLSGTIVKQFRFKLKSFSGMFITLVILQTLAVLFSLGGSGMMGGTRSSMTYEFRYYSVDIVIVFTMLWAFINAILIKTKAYREDDFNFITNRVSSNLSNILFLMAAGIAGGVTAYLAGYLLQVVVFFISEDSQALMLGGINYGWNIYAAGIIATILYIVMFSSLGYLIGSLVHLFKPFAYLIPVVGIGLVFFVEMQAETHLILEISQFYFGEDSFWLLCLKVITTSALLFAASMKISNRLEVR
ncbi:hypothetical protein ACFO3D_15210 [Virgibacillus kekensis]|uniref:ABC transporter permease n=1 Tax=Virgibacillus kekensis TaxID=202261 RepID=A0ABV9DLM3_9BACI